MKQHISEPFHPLLRWNRGKWRETSISQMLPAPCLSYFWWPDSYVHLQGTKIAIETWSVFPCLLLTLFSYLFNSYGSLPLDPCQMNLSWANNLPSLCTESSQSPYPGSTALQMCQVGNGRKSLNAELEMEGIQRISLLFEEGLSKVISKAPNLESLNDTH